MLIFHIIIPTYNRANLLPRAIESVLKQNYQNWYIYIIDDGSTDNTKQIVQKYLNKYPNKISYKYKPNGGVGSARNVGIELALQNTKNPENNRVIFLDSDDELTENALINIKNEIFNKKIKYCIATQCIDQHKKLFTNFPTSRIGTYKYYIELLCKGTKEHFYSFNLQIFKDKNLRFNENINGGEAHLYMKLEKPIYISNVIARIYYIGDHESIINYKILTPKRIKENIYNYSTFLKNYGDQLKNVCHKKYGDLLITLGFNYMLNGNKLLGLIYTLRSLKYSFNLQKLTINFLMLFDYKLYLYRFFKKIKNKN